MPKRLEIYVIQPAFQGTDNAMATYSIDFDDDSELDSAVSSIVEAFERNTQPYTITVTNGRREQIGFITQFYSGHRVIDVDERHEAFRLPPDGAASPERESEP